MTAMGTECANCGATLAGDYCHVCGQKRVTRDDLRLVRIFHDVFHVKVVAVQAIDAVTTGAVFMVIFLRLLRVI
jgi:recombinational DNA repair protein RecR